MCAKKLSETGEPHSPRWPRISVALAAVLSAVALPLYAYKVYRKADYTDFSVYYRAALRLKEGQWESIYNLGDGASPFRYAPLTLPLFRPFAEFSPVAARLGWYALQFLLFALSFALLERVVRLCLHARREPADRRPRAPSAGSAPHAPTAGIAALALLSIFRLILDSFTIGQVSSLLFLGFVGALLFWVRRAPKASSALLLIPTLFKIGPGIVFFAYLSGRGRELVRAWSTPIALTLGVVLASGAWLRSVGTDPGQLWQNWKGIVAADSQYYDASHYGSQSLKSALLRASQWGWFDAATAQGLYLAAVITGSAAIILLWFARKPRSLEGRALFFALGVFPYLWFMPETFKYSLATVAIPVALLLPEALRASRKTPGATLTRGALVAIALTLSLPGKDIVGDRIFFGIQKLSLPFLATVLLGLATWVQAWRRSLPSREFRAIRGAVFAEAPGPWRSLPAHPASARKLSVLAPLPMDRYVALEPAFLVKTLRELQTSLRAQAGEEFEILLIPFGNRVSAWHPLFVAAQALEKELRGLRLVSFGGPGSDLGNAIPSTAAVALREGFLLAQGQTIFVAHLEQPCAPEFYARAHALLQAGFALVRANRRDPESRFRIPVRLLELVYGRHKLGLAFNRIVRLLLPVPAQDTHSGSLALSRELALRAFALQAETGFLFDLELSLVAREAGLRETEIAVSIALGEEKGKGRMIQEALSILVGLPRLAWRFRHGFYRPLALGPTLKITADDWGISPGVNQGIAELARQGIVRRASAMADARFLAAHLETARGVPGFEFGLHFDLTFGKRSPGAVLKEWLDPRADRARLAADLQAEFRRQLGVLRAHGIEPAYFDGHHHIHLVPGVLDALAPELRREGLTTVRLPADPALWLSGRIAIPVLCLWARRRLRAHGLHFLACYYPKDPAYRAPATLHARLAALQARGVATEVIVHPAATADFAEHRIPDDYSAGRVTEYQALRMLSPRGFAGPGPCPEGKA